MQTIVFIAAQFAPSLGQNDQLPSSSGPPITIQAIMQISKLLSSVPHSMDPVTYFHNIAPELLVLMDGNDPDLKKTAAYVVGNGILGKRAYGVPGTIGHSIFVEPAFKAITATLDVSSRKWLRSYTNFDGDECLCDTAKLEEGILVSERELLVALERITLLTLQRPDPGLVKRLIHPILLPLWGLACYAEEQGNSEWYNKVLSLLQTYFNISANTHPLIKIIENLLWDGGPSWTYTRGPTGGVSLKERSSIELDFTQLVGSLDRRANGFTKLLSSDPQSDERTCDVFLYVSETWLRAVPNRDSSIQLNILQHEAESEFTTKKIISTKIAEKLLESFQDTLSRHPLKVLGLVKQLIESESNYCRNANDKRKQSQETGGPSLASLVNIVAHEDTDLSVESNRVDSAESLSASFSLLSSILASPGFSMSEDLRPMLEGIKTQLSHLVPYLPTTLSQPGATAAMLLDIHLSSLDGNQESKSISLHTADFDIHRQALRNISTTLPPVQAEGLALLSNLIIKSSPVLDIPSTLSLLVSLITEPSSEAAATEEFIYLHAIKSLGLLASKHPRTVINTLVDLYADRDEDRTIDQRLKIGESLLRTIQDLGEALVDEAAKVIGEGMISVAGRRARKSKAQEARKLQLDKERRKREREERESAMPSGWKISAPALLNDEFESPSLLDYDSDAENPEKAAVSAEILSAWAVGATVDLEPDDLRLRASAMSILGTAIQTNLMALGPSIASSTIDLALATLTHEPGPESAILRRASVVLLLDIIKVLDSTQETRRSGDIGFGFSFTADNASIDISETYGPATIGNIPTMLRTLNFVESQETDDIVRGHIRVLIESLEAWMEKSLLWGIGSHRDGKGKLRLELGGKIAGLNVDPLAYQDGQRKPKIEEVE